MRLMPSPLRLPTALLLPVCFMLASAADAAVLSPVTITKSFSPSPIVAYGTSVMTVSLTNPNGTPVTSTFTDAYPSGLVNTSPFNVTTDCVGTLNVSGAQFILTGTVPANGSCSVMASVTTLQSGALVNTASGVSGNPPTMTSGTSTLTALDAPLTKSFTPSTIIPGATSTLTIAFGNANGVTLGGAGFTDSYPAGLVNATLPNATTNCPGGVLTATPGGNTFSMSNAATVPPGGCTATVLVTSNTPNSYGNTVFLGIPPGAFFPGSAFATLTVAASTPALSSWVLLLLGLTIAAIGWTYRR